LIIEKFNILNSHNEIGHFITTRKDGHSLSPYQFCNMSYETTDEFTSANRHALSNLIKIPIQNFVYQHQTHSANIKIIQEIEQERSAEKHAVLIPDNDALITNQQNICLTAMAADCVPILLYDKQQKVIAAIHSGWRGTYKRITQKTIQMMSTHFNSSAQNIIACIGPSIAKCCYEVGEEIIMMFKTEFPNYQNIFYYQEATNKYHLDLWEVIENQLTEMGVIKNNIENKNICTRCNTDSFYSARAGDLGRFSVGIYLK